MKIIFCRFPKIQNLQKIATIFLLSIFLANLALAFALIPAQQAKAQVAVVAPATDTLLTEKSIIDKIWEFIDTAIQKVTSFFSGLSAITQLWDKAQKIGGTLLRAALLVLLNRILAMITNEIIKWINGGGAPKFVSDWAGFLRDAVNQAGGEFLNTLAGGFLCNPFAFQIRLALMPVPYAQQARCTLQQIGANMQAFFGNFTNGGGWGTWLQVIQPNNNFYGSYLMALDEKTRKEITASDKAKNEAMSGGGFLGDKKCMSCTVSSTAGGGTQTFNNMTECESWKKSSQGGSPVSFKCNREQIMTPASVAQYEVQQAVDSARSLLEKQIASLTGTTGMFTPYIMAIANALINRVITLGLSSVAQAIAGGDQSYGPTFNNPTAPTVPADSSTQQLDTHGISSTEDVLSSAPALIGNENLLKENLQGLLREQQTSLTVLNSTKSAQTQTLNALKDIYLQDCSLPSWATAQTNGNITRITATDIGEISIQITTASSSIGSTSSTQVQATSPAAQPQIDAMQSQIDATTLRISNTDSAIAANNSALSVAQQYQNLTGSSAAAGWTSSNDIAAAGKRVEDAYTLAVSTSQGAIASNKTNLTELLVDAQDQNIELVQSANQVSTDRGSLSSQLSSTQAKQTQAQTALTACSSGSTGSTRLP